MASAAMPKRLEGKTIIITRASSGIGRSTALEFARTSPKSLKLVLTARRLELLEGLRTEIGREVGNGFKIHLVKFDVSNSAEIKSFIENLPKEFKSIDILVNNA